MKHQQWNISNDKKESSNKPAITDSEGSQSSFASATHRAWLHVNRAEIRVRKEDVVNPKKKSPLSNLQVQIQPRRENSTSVSFKIGADLSLLDELNKPETWPEGIEIRRFCFFERNPRK